VSRQLTAGSVRARVKRFSISSGDMEALGPFVSCCRRWAGSRSRSLRFVDSTGQKELRGRNRRAQTPGLPGTGDASARGDVATTEGTYEVTPERDEERGIEISETKEPARAELNGPESG